VSLNAGRNWDLSLAIALCVTLYAGDTGGAGDDALCSPYAEDAGGDALCAILYAGGCGGWALLLQALEM